MQSQIRIFSQRVEDYLRPAPVILGAETEIAEVVGRMTAEQASSALIVDGEGSRLIQERTLARLSGPDATMADIFAEFATLTLGSGGAAAVIGRHSENSGSHRVVGGVARADTSHHNLCVGSLDQMHTDSKALLDAGLLVTKLAWGDAADDMGWTDMDRYIIHQISQRATPLNCETL